jgi:hypothetical protein
MQPGVGLRCHGLSANNGQHHRTYTDEQRAALSAAGKKGGMPFKYRAALSEANRRRVFSDETSAKMSVAAKRRGMSEGKRGPIAVDVE